PLGGAPQNDMVEDINLQQLPGANQVARHFDVRVARGRVAAGMIVDDDEGGSIGRDGAAENLPRVNENGVERAIRDFLQANQPPPRVQQNGVKGLHLEQPELLAQVIGNALG